jgi:hypothetical protein
MNQPAEYVNIRFNTLTEAPSTLCRLMQARQAEPFIVQLRQDDPAECGRPHEEFNWRGAILFKEHNDSINWDSVAMEQDKP